ncbi:hypothetical protein Esti_003623 [Eimeria stiedai]
MATDWCGGSPSSPINPRGCKCCCSQTHAQAGLCASAAHPVPTWDVFSCYTLLSRTRALLEGGSLDEDAAFMIVDGASRLLKSYRRVFSDLVKRQGPRCLEAHSLQREEEGPAPAKSCCQRKAASQESCSSSSSYWAERGPHAAAERGLSRLRPPQCLPGDCKRSSSSCCCCCSCNGYVAGRRGLSGVFMIAEAHLSFSLSRLLVTSLTASFSRASSPPSGSCPYTGVAAERHPRFLGFAAGDLQQQALEEGEGLSLGLSFSSASPAEAGGGPPRRGGGHPPLLQGEEADTPSQTAARRLDQPFVQDAGLQQLLSLLGDGEQRLLAGRLLLHQRAAERDPGEAPHLMSFKRTTGNRGGPQSSELQQAETHSPHAAAAAASGAGAAAGEATGEDKDPLLASLEWLAGQSVEECDALYASAPAALGSSSSFESGVGGTLPAASEPHALEDLLAAAPGSLRADLLLHASAAAAPGALHPLRARLCRYIATAAGLDSGSGPAAAAVVPQEEDVSEHACASFASLLGEPGPAASQETGLAEVLFRGLVPSELYSACVTGLNGGRTAEGLYAAWDEGRGELFSSPDVSRLLRLLAATRRGLLSTLPAAFGGGPCTTNSSSSSSGCAYVRGSKGNRMARQGLLAVLHAALLQRRRLREEERWLRFRESGKSAAEEEQETEECLAKALDCLLLLALHGGSLTCLLEFLETLTKAAAEEAQLEVFLPALHGRLHPHHICSTTSSSSLLQQQQQQQGFEKKLGLALPSLDALELLALQTRCSFTASLDGPKTFCVGCSKKQQQQQQQQQRVEEEEEEEGREAVVQPYLSSAIGSCGAAVTQLKLLLPAAAAAGAAAAAAEGHGCAAADEMLGDRCLLLEFLYGNERLLRLRSEGLNSGTSGGLTSSPFSSQDDASVLAYIEASPTAVAVWVRQAPAEPQGEEGARVAGGVADDGAGANHQQQQPKQQQQKALVALLDVRGQQQLTLDILVDGGPWQSDLLKAAADMEASASRQQQAGIRRTCSLVDAVVRGVQQPREEVALYVNGRRLCCLPLPSAAAVAPSLQGQTKQLLLRVLAARGALLVSPACAALSASLVEELRNRALLSGSQSSSSSSSSSSSRSSGGNLSLQELVGVTGETLHRLCMRAEKEGPLGLLTSSPAASTETHRRKGGSLSLAQEGLSGMQQVVAAADGEAVECCIRLLEQQQGLWQRSHNSSPSPAQHHCLLQQQQQLQQQEQQEAAGFSKSTSSVFRRDASCSTRLTVPSPVLTDLCQRSYSGSQSLDCLSGSCGSMSVRPMLPDTWSRGPVACSGEPFAAAAAAGGDEVLSWSHQREEAIEKLRKWRASAETVYCVLSVLRLLLSKRHPLSAGVSSLLRPSFAGRLLECLLRFFNATPPSLQLCTCCRCSGEAAKDPELVQALYDAQGGVWLLRKVTTGLLSAATPEVLDSLLHGAKVQTLQLLLLALSKPAHKLQQQERFVAALLQLLDSRKAGQIVVTRLLRETRAAAAAGGSSTQQSGSSFGMLELLPGCRITLQDPAVSFWGPSSSDLPDPASDSSAPAAAAAAAGEGEEEDVDESSSLTQLGIWPSGFRAVGAASASFLGIARSDLQHCSSRWRGSRFYGRVPVHPKKEGMLDFSILRQACDQLSSSRGSGFWPFFARLLEATEEQQKAALLGGQAVSPGHAPCCFSKTAAAHAPALHPTSDCLAWGPCAGANGGGAPCGRMFNSSTQPLHAAPGLRLGVLANPRLVGLPTGAATGTEGCACMEMHRPALWAPLQHKLQQLHDAVERCSSNSSSGSSSGSCTPAAHVAAYLVRHAAELWLSRLFSLLQQPLQQQQHSNSKKQRQGVGLFIGSRSDAQQEQQQEYFRFGESLLPQDASHSREAADTWRCLEELLRASLRTANNLLSLLLDCGLTDSAFAAWTAAAAAAAAPGGNAAAADCSGDAATGAGACRACELQGRRVLEPMSTGGPPVYRTSLAHGCTFIGGALLPLLTYITILLQRLVSLGAEAEPAAGSSSSSKGSKVSGLSEGTIECVVGVVGLVLRLWPSVLQLSLRCLLLLRRRGTCVLEGLGRGSSSAPVLHPLVEESLGVVNAACILLQRLAEMPALLARLDVAYSCCFESSHLQQQQQQEAQQAAAEALRSLPPLLVGGARYMAAEEGHPFAAFEDALRSSVLLLLDSTSRVASGFTINEFHLPCCLEDFLAATQQRIQQQQEQRQQQEPSSPVSVTGGELTAGKRALGHVSAFKALDGKSPPAPTAAAAAAAAAVADTSVLLQAPSAAAKAPVSSPPTLAVAGGGRQAVLGDPGASPSLGTGGSPLALRLPGATADALHAAASSAVAAGVSCCPSLLRLLRGEAEAQEFGENFISFHRGLADVQRAVGAAVLHLLGYQSLTAAAEGTQQTALKEQQKEHQQQQQQQEQQEAEALVRLAASLARKAAIQLLSNWQRRTVEAGPASPSAFVDGMRCLTPLPLSDSEESCVGSPTNSSSSSSSSSAQQRGSSREEEVRGIVARCAWVLKSCPRGLAGPKSHLFFSRWVRLLVRGHRVQRAKEREAEAPSSAHIGSARISSCPPLSRRARDGNWGFCCSSKPVAWGHRRTVSVRAGASLCCSLQQQAAQDGADPPDTPRLLRKFSARESAADTRGCCLPHNRLSVARTLDFLRRFSQTSGNRLAPLNKSPHPGGFPFTAGRAAAAPASEEVVHKRRKRRNSRRKFAAAASGMLLQPSAQSRHSSHKQGSGGPPDSSMEALISFLLRGPDVQLFTRVLRVEQLAAVTRYVILRSMKALLLVGLCSSSSGGGGGSTLSCRGPDNPEVSLHRKLQEELSAGSATHLLLAADGDRADSPLQQREAMEKETIPSSPRLSSIPEDLPLVAAAAAAAAGCSASRNSRSADLAAAGEGFGGGPPRLRCGGSGGRLVSQSFTQQQRESSDGQQQLKGSEVEGSEASCCREASNCTTASSEGTAAAAGSLSQQRMGDSLTHQADIHYPLLVDLLTPSATQWRLACGQHPLRAPPSGTAKRYAGWVLLRMLHSLGVSLLETKPAFYSLQLQGGEKKDKKIADSPTPATAAPTAAAAAATADAAAAGGSSLASSSATSFWKTQPLADALYTSLSDIVRIAFQWHLERNLPAMSLLVQPPAPDTYLMHPADLCWMDSVLRVLTVHVCLKTEPLDHSDSVVLYLQHLLTLAHPVPLRLSPGDRHTSRSSFGDTTTAAADIDDAFASDLNSTIAPAAAAAVAGGVHPLNGLGFSRLINAGSSPREEVCYVPVAAAVTRVVVRCFSPRHWGSDLRFTQRGFRLRHKATTASGYTLMLYVQRRQLAELFAPPLRSLSRFTVSSTDADEVFGPLRGDSKAGPGFLSFSFTGPGAAEPDGMEEVISDVRLLVEVSADPQQQQQQQQQESVLRRLGYTLETSFPVTSALIAHLWVKRGLLAYEAPSADVEASAGSCFKTGVLRLRSSSRLPSAPLARQSLAMRCARQQLPSVTLGGPGRDTSSSSSSWEEDLFMQQQLEHGTEGDCCSKSQQSVLLSRQYEGASRRLQESAWLAFQAALWFLLVGPEDSQRAAASAAASSVPPGQLRLQEECAVRGSRQSAHAHSSPLGSVAGEALKMTLAALQQLVELQQQALREAHRSSSMGPRSTNGSASEFAASLQGGLPLQSRAADHSSAGTFWEELEASSYELAAAAAANGSSGVSRTSSVSEAEGISAPGEEAPTERLGYQRLQNEKVLLTEKLIGRLLVILLRCVRQSVGAAALFMKTLMCCCRTLPVQLEAALLTLESKTCMYTLMTECVRQLTSAAAREGGEPLHAASGFSTDVWKLYGGPPTAAAAAAPAAPWGGPRMCPPLQPISTGSLLVSAGQLVKRGPLEGSSSQQQQDQQQPQEEEEEQRQQQQQTADESLPFLSCARESGSAPPGPALLLLPQRSMDPPLLQAELMEPLSGPPDPAVSLFATSSAPANVAAEATAAAAGAAGGAAVLPRGEGEARVSEASLFQSLPQSEVFLCSQASAEFEAQVHERALHVTRALNLGGVALCRVPLTFPALQREPGEAADMIGFRIWSAGRFGVTVAPADCVLAAPQEIFDRNDVVGFRTSNCPPFWRDIFAAHVSYQRGDYLGVKFTVDDQPNGQRCLHTELHVAGESIGSVLEVFYDQASQVDQARRMNLVFVVQDPLTIVYGGPNFTLQYRAPDLTEGFISRPETAEAAEPEEQQQRMQPPTWSMLRWQRRHSLFQKSLQMYQAVMLAPDSVLLGEKSRVLKQLCDHLHAAASSLDAAAECMQQKQAKADSQATALSDLQLRPLMWRSGSSEARSFGLRALEEESSSSSGQQQQQQQNVMLQRETSLGAASCLVRDFASEMKRQSSSGLRVCVMKRHHRSAGSTALKLRACRQGISVLAVLACDCSGKGELQDLLLSIERPKEPEVIAADAIHHSLCDSNQPEQRDSVTAGTHGGADLGLSLPWLVSTSSLSLSSVSGLSFEECERLLVSLCDVLTSPMVQTILQQLAVEGNLVASSQEEELLQAAAVTLGSKAVVSLCLVLRAMLNLRPDGKCSLSARAFQALDSLLSFLQHFCLLTCGLQPRQVDPFAVASDLTHGSPPQRRRAAAASRPHQQQHHQRATKEGAAASACCPRSASAPPLRGRNFSSSSGTSSSSSNSDSSSSSSSKPSFIGGSNSPFSSHTPAGSGAAASSFQRRSYSLKSELRLMRMARLCGIPESVLATEGLQCPAVAEQAVLAAAETPRVWQWVFGLNEAWHEAVEAAVAGPQAAAAEGKVALDQQQQQQQQQLLLGSGAELPAASLFLLKPRQIGGFMHFKGPIDVRIFSFEGSCSLGSGRLAHRLVDTPLRWALRRDMLHLVCAIAAFSPELLISRLHRGIKDSLSARAPRRRRASAAWPAALNVLRLFRICTYFLSREKDDNMPDSQQPFRLHVDTEPTRELLRQLDRHSVVGDPLYGWQRVFYTAAARWTDAACVQRLHRLLQTELLFHLVGSVSQVVINNTRRGEGSTKYCALSPSVYVAHWLMDTFVRHPLCPGSIRRAVVYPLSYSSLFALLINGSSLPFKLGLDAARMTHWLLALYMPDASADSLAATAAGGEGASGTRAAAVWWASTCQQEGEGFKAFFKSSWQGAETVQAEVAGEVVRGPHRQFLGFLQSYFDCLCFLGASVFDNLEKTTSWRASTLDCFSGADLARVHVRYRINCSLLAHYLATACVSVLKADKWGSLTWMDLNSTPILADLVSYLLAAECVAAASCSSTWAASAGTPATSLGVGSTRNLHESAGETAFGGSSASETDRSSRRPAALTGGRVGNTISGESSGELLKRALPVFSPAFIRSVQTLPVPVAFAEPIWCTKAVGRLEALPGVRLELNLCQPVATRRTEKLSYKAVVQGEWSCCPPGADEALAAGGSGMMEATGEATELRKTPRLLAALDRGMQHLIGESPICAGQPEWQHVFVSSSASLSRGEELHMRARRIQQGSGNSKRDALNLLVAANLHAPTPGRSYACSSTPLHCGSSAASCSITFALRTSGSDKRGSDLGLSSSSEENPIKRVLVGVVDGARKSQIEEGSWDGAADACFVQLSSRELTSAFTQKMPGVHWSIQNQRGSKPSTVLAHLLKARGGGSGAAAAAAAAAAQEEGGSDCSSHDLITSAAVNGLTFVIRAIGRHLLWFAEGQLVAAQVLPPSASEVWPVVVIRESNEACLSPGVPTLWRSLILIATLSFYGDQRPIRVAANEVFYTLEEAPANHPTKLVRVPSFLDSSPSSTAAAAAEGRHALYASLARTEDERISEPQQQQQGRSFSKALVGAPRFEGSPSGLPMLADTQPSAAAAPAATDFAAAGDLVSSRQWSIFTLSTTIRSGAIQQLPPGVPVTFTSPAWRWLRLPRRKCSPEEEDSGTEGREEEELPSAADAEAAKTGSGSFVFHIGSLSNGSNEARFVTEGGADSEAAAVAAPPTLSSTGVSTRAVMLPSPPPPLGNWSVKGATQAAAFAAAARASDQQQQLEGPQSLIWAGPPAAARATKSVNPALPFRVLFGGSQKAGGGGASPSDCMQRMHVVGIIWGCCRWLWFSNGRLVCPLDLPLAVLMQQHLEATTTSSTGSNEWREVQVTKGVCPYTARDVVEIEYQPSIPALFFRKNGVYQFGLNFNEFYGSCLSRSTPTGQAAAESERESTGRSSWLLQPAPSRVRSTELIAAGPGGSVRTGSCTPASVAVVQDLFLAIRDGRVRSLLCLLSSYRQWLEEEDLAAAPNSCTFASLERKITAGGAGGQRQSLQQQHEDSLFEGHAVETPLKLAVKKGHLEVVKLLIEQAGCNPDGVGADGEGVTPLMVAAEMGHTDIIASLVRSYSRSVDRTDADGNTALHRVALRAAGHPVTGSRTVASCPGGYEQTVKLLLALGADPTLRNDEGYTPVDMIVSRAEGVGEGSDAVEKLLRYATGLYVDGERRDAQQQIDRNARTPAARSCSVATGSVADPDLSQQQKQQRLSDLEAGHMSSSSGLGGVGQRGSMTSSGVSASLLSTSSAATGIDRWLASLSDAADLAQVVEGAGDGCAHLWAAANKAPGSSSSSRGSRCLPPSVLRTVQPPPEMTVNDARELLQQLLMAGLDLYGDEDAAPHPDRHPGVMLPLLPPASSALVRDLTLADDVHALRSVVVSIVRRLLVLEEQQVTQQQQTLQMSGQQQQQQQQQQTSAAAAQAASAGWRSDGLSGARWSHEERGRGSFYATSVNSSLQQLVVCAEAADTPQALVHLLLPLDVLAARIKGSTRRGWVEGVNRQAWRHRVARELGYQISLGGAGGLLWTPDVDLLAEASAAADCPQRQQQQLGLGSALEGGGLLVVRTVLDSNDVILHSAMCSWPLKLDIWLRQIVDLLENVEDSRGVSLAEKHLRIAAFIWKADGDRDALLSFCSRLGLPVKPRESLEEIEQAAALKDAVLSLINEALFQVVPKNCVELLCKQLIGFRLRLLGHLNACAMRAVPVVSPIFNIPKLPLDYYGLLTAHAGSAFFQGIHLRVSSSRGEAKAAGGAAENGRRCYSSNKMVLQVGPSDLPIEMSCYLFVRQLMTSPTVHALWRHVIEKLGYSGHEQPSIHLDRGQAATAKSLAHTLWYQATTQLLSAKARPCRLRARVGDRPFMVVLQGEGATDFGGPLQEFLSWLADEVMGPLADSPGIDIPSFLACLPCPNSAHAMGPHQDSVVLRPDWEGPPPDPLVSPADLQQQRRQTHAGAGSGLLFENSGFFPTQTEATTKEGSQRSSMHCSGEGEQQAWCMQTGASTSAFSSSFSSRNWEVNSLWTPETIANALPIPSRRTQQNISNSHNASMPAAWREQQQGRRAAPTQSLQAHLTPSAPPPTELRRGAHEGAAEHQMHMLMYEALGRLMAMCFCIGTAFNVTFNPLLWKKLTAAPLSIDDVADADCVAVEMIRSLRRMAAVPAEFWDAAMEVSLSDMSFSTEDALGRSIELVQGGAEVPVTALNLSTFIRLSERFRLLEDREGVEAVLRGIAAVLPLGRMRLLFDWRRLECGVCGERKVDVEALRAHTACTSEVLKNQLFSILETFTNVQMQRFLRFVCGRSRLPIANSEWRMTVDFETSENEQPMVIDDNRLPTAATCSFRLLMPFYSSTDVMKQRLLYAISNCTAIDLDACVVHEQMQLMYDD